MNSRILQVKEQFGGSGSELGKDERSSGSSTGGRISLLVI